MGSARESMDLTTKHGRRAFWLRIKEPIKTAAKDTFGKMACWTMRRHKVMHRREYSEHIWWCNRCGRFVDPPNNYNPRASQYDGIMKGGRWA